MTVLFSTAHQGGLMRACLDSSIAYIASQSKKELWFHLQFSWFLFQVFFGSIFGFLVSVSFGFCLGFGFCWFTWWRISCLRCWIECRKIRTTDVGLGQTPSWSLYLSRPFVRLNQSRSSWPILLRTRSSLTSFQQTFLFLLLDLIDTNEILIIGI